MSPAPPGRDDTVGGSDATPGLARSAAAGARWSLVSNLIQQVGRLVFTLILAAMIGPADFGIVAQAVIYIGLVQLFLDQGFGSALIQKKDVDRLDLGSVFWLNVVTGSLLAVVTVVVAPAVAGFFSTPELTEVLRVLAVSLLIYSFAAVPQAMMNRGLHFKAMAAIDIVAVTVGGVAGVVHAVLGGGYWALVTQTLVAASLTLVGLLRLSGPPPLRGSIARLRAMLTFSSSMFASRVLNYAGQNGDNLLVGRFLGASELAFYTMAYRVLLLPTQTLGRLVNQVAFPVYSRLQHDVPKVREWFLLSSRATALLSYPLLTLGVFLEPLAVEVVLGEEWLPAVLPMQILTLAAFRNMTLKLQGPVFMAFGRSRSVVFNSVLSVVVTLGGVAIGLRWGIVGVAVGVLVARLVIGPIIMRSCGLLLQMGRWEYSRTMLPVWVACLVLAGVWYGAQQGGLAAGWARGVPEATASVLALLVYAALVRLVFRSSYRDAQKVLGMVLKRKRPVPADPSQPPDTVGPVGGIGTPGGPTSPGRVLDAPATGRDDRDPAGPRPGP